MPEPDPLHDVVFEYLDMLRVSTQLDGPEKARDAMLKLFEDREPESLKLLLVAALELMIQRPVRNHEALLRNQAKVTNLREMLTEGQRRIGINPALEAMTTELAKREPGELASLLTVAVYSLNLR